MSIFVSISKQYFNLLNVKLNLRMFIKTISITNKNKMCLKTDADQALDPPGVSSSLSANSF